MAFSCKPGWKGRGFAVIVVQRFGGALNLSVHLHALVLNGVFARGADGRLRFHRPPAPTAADVADVLSAIVPSLRARLAGQSLDDDGASTNPFAVVQTASRTNGVRTAENVTLRLSPSRHDPEFRRMSHLQGEVPDMRLSRPKTLAEWLRMCLPLMAALFLPVTASAQTGSITGTVTNSSTGAPIAGVPIAVIRSENLSDAGIVDFQPTNASGVYTFSLPPGAYYIVAVPSEEGLDYVDEIFGGIRGPIDFPDLVDGTLVIVTAGNTATANLALLPGGHVTGTVTDAATGAPLANVLVQSVYRYGNSFDYWLTDAMTDAAGRYDIGGLAPGQIFLITRSFNVPGYVDEYWDNNPCVGGCGDSSAQVPAPTPITIVSGVTVAAKDFALDPGGVISGRITNAAGAPIPSLGVNINALVNGSAAVPGQRLDERRRRLQLLGAGYGNLLRLHRSRQLRLHERALRQHPVPARV